MDLALALSALMLGLAGTPHCVAMCGAACAALGGRPGGDVRWSFHAARVAGYAVAGAVAAGSVGALASLAQVSPALRPLWTLAHAAALALGLWLLWHGRQPAWMAGLGRGRRAPAAPAGRWQRISGPARGAAAGAAWVAWPCGLLKSAQVVAALAHTPPGGALVMAAFAVASGTGLVAGPWLWSRLGGPAAGLQAGGWATRVAGAMLAGASAWALAHDMIRAAVAWCFS